MVLIDGFQDWGLLALRVAIGAIFVYHGMPKLKSEMAKKMAPGIGIPVGLFTLIGLGEVVAGLAAILGVYTQIAGLFIGLVMIGALYLKVTKWKVPFSSMKGPGWEFDLILLGAAIALFLVGSGAISVDAAIGLWP